VNILRILLLTGAAALLLSGCYGYGAHMYPGPRSDHMYADDYGGHMGRERARPYQAAPCDRDDREPRNETDEPPCQSNR